jgi:putative ABC transport system ATP-binding protein
MPDDSVAQILRRVDLTVSSGECVAIMGPSGSGKSSLLAIAGLLQSPTSGNVTLDNVEVTALSDTRRTEIRNGRFGFVFQNFALQPHINARRNVELPLVYRGVAGRKRAELAEALLDRVGLGDRFSAMPRHLSGGEQQRVAIARALVGSPQFIFADEPTAALDISTGRAVVGMLREQVQTLGCALVLVTHDPAVAALMDRTVEIVDGEISV